MKGIAYIALGLALWVSTFPAAAQPRPTFESLWNEVSRDSNCVQSDQGNFILFWCKTELTYWYFTRPDHPAYPGVIRRTIAQQQDGSWIAQEHGSSFAPDEAQPAFKAWLAQIADLDRQMRESIEKNRNVQTPEKPN